LYLFLYIIIFLFTARESELRYLRKTVTDQEQEVSVLDKHIGNMNNGIIKLMANTEKLKVGCSKYEQYLIQLRSLFLDSFSNISFPGKYFKLKNKTVLFLLLLF